VVAAAVAVYPAVAVPDQLRVVRARTAVNHPGEAARLAVAERLAAVATGWVVPAWQTAELG
jgi:hypothetical protein